MERMFISGVYAALIVLVVFLYVRMRRLEGHLHAVDATLDTVLAEAPPSEFLPSFEQRIAALEALSRAQTAKNASEENLDDESGSESDSDEGEDEDEDENRDSDIVE